MQDNLIKMLQILVKSLLCFSGGAISLIDHSNMTLNGSNFTENKAQPLFEYNDTMLLGCPEGIICMISKNTIFQSYTYTIT